MPTVRIALANLAFPASPEAAVAAARAAISEAADAGAHLVCFPECFVPGYRALGAPVPPADPVWLDHAHRSIAGAAGDAGIAVALGTERFVDGALRITVLVIGPDGSLLGWQDKVQLDPSEDHLYEAGAGREVFTVGDLTFGVVICHEGWRYPETVRAAVRAGAQLVLHPHFSPAEPDGSQPGGYAEPANSFHEAAVLCRAAENTAWFATVNCAADGAPTTSAIARPDGTLLAFQPHGEQGLLVCDLDLAQATRALALRLRESSQGDPGK
ncbi:MAG TPA: carbon-nitrogen hydrolase family protein [Propionicimonas sp.]|jgi:predicted amidohydrolase|uniref:carbon-nitrogen hydrolase family protein n=1 Tax=Propionicimonas sp. TaxID=1955623 RepID=UPI002F403D3A